MGRYADGYTHWRPKTEVNLVGISVLLFFIQEKSNDNGKFRKHLFSLNLWHSGIVSEGADYNYEVQQNIVKVLNLLLKFSAPIPKLSRSELVSCAPIATPPGKIVIYFQVRDRVFKIVGSCLLTSKIMKTNPHTIHRKILENQVFT